MIDGLRLRKVQWYGALDDVAFLSRLYDLSELPSRDSRFSDAAGDIWQHRINNYDWDDDWVYDDSRFDLLGCEDQEFLEFLCELVHPVVRPDREEAELLARDFNDQLRIDDWELVAVERIASRPRFEAARVGNTVPSLSEARRVADALQSGWLHQEIRRAERALDHDPSLAIGTAKEMVETCCKTVLTRAGKTDIDRDDFPKLVKRTVKLLQLTRGDVSESARGADAIKTLLSNLSAITTNMNELRNHYGTGHGREGQYRGLEPRHAKLAVTCAIAFVAFVADTYAARGLNNEHLSQPPDQLLK